MPSDNARQRFDEALPGWLGDEPLRLIDVAELLPQTHYIYDRWKKAQLLDPRRYAFDPPVVYRFDGTKAEPPPMAWRETVFSSLVRSAAPSWGHQVPDPEFVLRPTMPPARPIDLSQAQRRGARCERQDAGRLTLLFGGIEMWLQRAIASPTCITTGFLASGERVEVSRDVAFELLIDLEVNTLRTRDGAVVWSGVIVRARALAAVDLDPVPQAKPKAGVGGNREKDDSALLAAVKAAREDDPLLSMRGAILKHAVPPKATESEQEAIVRRLTKKLTQRT